MTSTGNFVPDVCAILLGYIDPGSGSVIFQVILGAIAASGVAISLVWRQARAMVGRVFSRKSSDEQGK